VFVVSYEFMGYSQVEWKGVGVGAFSWEVLSDGVNAGEAEVADGIEARKEFPWLTVLGKWVRGRWEVGGKKWFNRMEEVKV
jgi:hypothetical protein